MSVRDLNLRNKILFSTGFVVLVSFICVIWLVSTKSVEMAKTSAFKTASHTATQYSNQVTSELNVPMNSIRTLASTFEGLKDTNNTDRASMNSMIINVLKDNPTFLATWTVWEPNALDAKDANYANTPGSDVTGRFIPYWNRGAGDIGLDALSDYETPGAGDYYLIPKENQEETIIEPYLYEVSGKEVATKQMADGSSRAVKSVENIGVIAEQTAASTQEVSAASEEQAASMASVSQSAEALAKIGENLTQLVGKFKL